MIMKKRSRNNCSLILALMFSICMFSNYISVSASSEIKDTIRYDEITDPYELIDYITEKKHADNITFNLESDQIVITQLLEKTVYSNERVESYYSTSNILLVDDNGKMVSRTDLLSYSERVYSGTTSSTGGYYNLVDVCTAYWEWKIVDSCRYARCIKTTNRLVGNTGGQNYVNLLNCCFRQTDDNFETHFYQVQYFNPSNYSTYIAYNPNQTFVRTTGGGG